MLGQKVKLVVGRPLYAYTDTSKGCVVCVLNRIDPSLKGLTIQRIGWVSASNELINDPGTPMLTCAREMEPKQKNA